MITICLLGLIFEVSTYTGSSAIMPYGVLILATLLSLFWLIQSILGLKNHISLNNESILENSEILKLFIFICIILIYVIGISLIGFFSSTIIAIPIISISMGYKNPKGIILTTILFTSIIFMVFKIFLKVPLPIEIWNRFLGV